MRVAVQARSLWHRVLELGFTCARMIVRPYAWLHVSHVFGIAPNFRNLLYWPVALSEEGHVYTYRQDRMYMYNDPQTCQLALLGSFDSLFAMNDWPLILVPACPFD